MEKKIFTLVCHSPEIDIYLFTSLRKCKKFFIEELLFEENDWEKLIDGEKVEDADFYYWEFRKKNIITY